MRVVNRHKIDAAIHKALPRSTYDSLKGVYYGARELTGLNPGRGRVYPDFLIIGSTKCATTSLHGWLCEHPCVAESTKEIHFFNINYYRGHDWYRTHFPTEVEREQFAAEHGQKLLAGEGTASYMADYWTPQRAAKLVPEAKLIVSLRNPVDRAHSQYHYFRRRGSEPLETFEEAIAAEPERVRLEQENQAERPHTHSWRLHRWGYLATSRYAEALERWFEVFPREQFMFLSFEDEVVGAPQRALDRICGHLDLPPHNNENLPTLNAGTYEPMAAETREQLNEYFRPYNQRLYELIGIDFGWPR